MDDAEEIRALYRQYWAAERSRDAEAIAAFYTADARLIPPGQGPLIGPTKVRRYFEKSFEGLGGSNVEADLSHIEPAGDLAWVAGLAHWQDEDRTRHLAFLDVWRREKGSWRIAACSWNSSDGFLLS
jgi:uncharacterized protein (TIGR02246 family)